ncbi:MAG: protein of unknown function DUF354, partial [uncultured Thermoleophilia bacterium]
EGLDRPDGTGPSARAAPGHRAAPDGRSPRRGHGAGLRPDDPALRPARHRLHAHRCARRARAGREGPGARRAHRGGDGLGAAPALRPGGRPRLQRPRPRGPRPGRARREHVRLRVRHLPAPDRLPPGPPGPRARGDPGRAAGRLRRPTAEARPVPRSEGGVLPGRLRARPGRAARARARPGQGPDRRPDAARRVALPPPLEPAVPGPRRAARTRPRRAGRRSAADGRPGRLGARARSPLARRAGASRRRPEPDRPGGPGHLLRRHDEPGGRRARRARLHDLRRPARGRRRVADPRGTAASAGRPGRPAPGEADRRGGAGAPRSGSSGGLDPRGRRAL